MNTVHSKYNRSHIFHIKDTYHNIPVFLLQIIYNLYNKYMHYNMQFGKYEIVSNDSLVINGDVILKNNYGHIT